MNKDIWMINHYAVPTQLPGGTRHYEFASHLVARGYTITLWLSLFHHGSRQYVHRALRERTKQESPQRLFLRWIWSFPHQDNDWRRVLNMLSFSLLFFCRALFAPRPQVVIASSPHLLACLAGWALSKIKRSRFILEIRDVWPDSLAVLGLQESSLLYKVLYRLAHLLYRKSPRIIVLTEGIKDTLVRQGVDGNKIVFLPNGISADLLENMGDREKTRAELGFAGKYVFLYAGAHGPANDLETVLELARILRPRVEIAIVLMGDGPEKKKLQALAREMNLDNLTFWDPVPKSSVHRVIHAADALLLTLKKDKLFEGARPNKLFDYLASGRPVICAVDGEARKLVEELQVGVFARPGDPWALAEAACHVYSNRQELGARAVVGGPAYVAEHGSREKMTDILEQVIVETCGRVRC